MAECKKLSSSLKLKGTTWRGKAVLLALDKVLIQKVVLKFTKRPTKSSNGYYLTITRTSQCDSSFDEKEQLFSAFFNTSSVIKGCQLKTEQNKGHSSFLRLKILPDGSLEYRQLTSIENALSSAVGGILSQCCQTKNKLSKCPKQAVELKGTKWFGQAKVLFKRDKTDPKELDGLLFQKVKLIFLERKTIVSYGYFVNIHWRTFLPDGRPFDQGVDELTGFADFDGVIRLAELGNNHSSLCNLRLQPDGNLEYRFLESADAASGLSQAIGGTLSQCCKKIISPSCFTPLQLKGTRWIGKGGRTLTELGVFIESQEVKFFCSDLDCPAAYRIRNDFRAVDPKTGNVVEDFEIFYGFMDADGVIRTAEVAPESTSFVCFRFLPDETMEFIITESSDTTLSLTGRNILHRVE